MGRRPIGKIAMSGAERTRQYRLKRAADKPVTKQGADLGAELRQASERIASLEAELAGERAKPPHRGDDGADIAALRQRLAEVEAERDRLRAERLRLRFGPKPRAAKVEKAPLPPDEQRDREIKALRTRVRNLTAELRGVSRTLNDARQNQYIPPALRREILVCLHPDGFTDPKEKRRYEKAFQDFTAHFPEQRKRTP